MVGLEIRVEWLCWGESLGFCWVFWGGVLEWLGD